MRHLQLQFENEIYPVWIGTGCLDIIAAKLLEFGGSSYHVVTDATVGGLHAPCVFERLAAAVPTRLWQVGDGEAVKSLATVERLSGDMALAGIDRGSVIVAVGGGVVGNLAGLMAALLFRGIRLAHLPTTLIAAADSVASLKQAVNLPQGKNLLGCFHKPCAALIDISLLQTLPAEQIRSGMCEIIKNALTLAPEHIALLESWMRPEAVYSDAELGAIVEAGLLAKQNLMCSDKYERKRAIVFEYGHTVGHAIELSAGGTMTHGEAVGLGMIVAAEVSYRLGRLGMAGRELHHRLLARNGVALRLPAAASVPEIMTLLRMDNKRGYLYAGADEVAMILLDAPGCPSGPAERPLTLVPAALVRECIEHCLVDGNAAGVAPPSHCLSLANDRG